MSDENGSVEAGNPVSEAAPEPTPAPEAQPAAPEAAAPFYSGFQNEELRGFVENKGVKEPEQLASMYHNLEKMMGADKAGRTVVLPGPDADEAALGEFYGKLGRPEAPDGYELPVPDGDDGKMAEWAQGVFHEAGLTAKQAALVSEKWNARVGEMVNGQQAEAQQTAEQAEAELKKEWGAAYDQKVAGVENAAVALGMSENELLGLRASMGPAAAMKFVDSLAGKLGEDTVENGEPMDGALTPAGANEALARLGTDRDFMAAWMDKNHPSHKWAVEHKSKLARQAAGVRG
jgi:hypothetical protein